MFNHIINARKRLKGHANHTPVMTSGTLNKLVGADIYLKCENFQKMGAFKFRGAYNSISKLTNIEKSKGVITYSSGNHGQAVALVGKMLKVETTIIMPRNAPATKLAAAKGYGAIVIEYNPETQSREDIALKIQEEQSLTMIPPFDHTDVIAGQGTATLELFDQAGPLDMLLTPCGGGGLLSGCAIAAKGKNPDCKVIGVEPALADDACKSFKTRMLHTIKNPETIADGTRTTSLGKITFPLILENVDDMVSVSEKQIIQAVQFLFFRMKIVVEPSGALGLAALLNKKVVLRKKIGVILSGGNIDAETMRLILKS
ncbi:threo-3-hydroxy-L-aspartate ammonia-lyase [Desulfobacula sp.]